MVKKQDLQAPDKNYRVGGKIKKNRTLNGDIISSIYIPSF